MVEGQQAEKYLNKKREKASEIAAEKDKFNSRYNSDSGEGQGPRGNHSAEANWPPTARNNPRYNTAREICKHREKYADVMPNVLSRSEKELSSVERKEMVISSKARNIIDKDMDRRLYISDYDYPGSYKYDEKKIKMNSAEYQAAQDAARWHVRRHPDQYKESVCIFSSINFI